LAKGCSWLANYFFIIRGSPDYGALPAAATGAPATGQPGGIAAEIDATAAWQHHKSGKYPQMLVIFAIGRDGSALNHERGSDRQTLRQTAQLMTYR
jgi:hypothetical protein